MITYLHRRTWKKLNQNMVPFKSLNKNELLSMYKVPENYVEYLATLDNYQLFEECEDLISTIQGSPLKYSLILKAKTFIRECSNRITMDSPQLKTGLHKLSTSINDSRVKDLLKELDPS